MTEWFERLIVWLRKALNEGWTEVEIAGVIHHDICGLRSFGYDMELARREGFLPKVFRYEL